MSRYRILCDFTLLDCDLGKRITVPVGTIVSPNWFKKNHPKWVTVGDTLAQEISTGDLYILDVTEGEFTKDACEGDDRLAIKMVLDVPVTILVKWVHWKELEESPLVLGIIKARLEGSLK